MITTPTGTVVVFAQPRRGQGAAKIDELHKQMRAAAAASHPGQRPVLAVTSALKDTPVLSDLVARLHDQKIHAEIVFVPENDIVGTGRGLRAPLGFGEP